MTYTEILEVLFNLKGTGLDLRPVLQELDNPQERFVSVRVGGTNGKGSTAVFLAGMLEAAGYRVGLFTSPHLVEAEERIQINRAPISPLAFEQSFERVWRVLQELHGSEIQARARFFQVVLAMALEYFARQAIEIAVLEAGVGGRRDATSLVRPVLGLLTNVDLDHCEVLGETLEAIAEEKAGIAPPGVTLLTAEQKPRVLRVIERICASQNSKLERVDLSRLHLIRSDWDGQVFHWDSLRDLEISSLGRYQLENAATALSALELLKKEPGIRVSERAMREGLKKASWPGRMELLRSRPYLLFDGAKNPAGARALRASLQALDFEKLIFVLGIATRKDISQMVAEIAPQADCVIVSQASYRGSDPEPIAHAIRAFGVPCEIIARPDQALERALAQAGADDLVCVTGSLFLVGELRSIWQNRAFAKV